MIREGMRVLVLDVSTETSEVHLFDERNSVVGGSGLAAFLYMQYGHPNLPWSHDQQPLIFTIGPLTGFFPLMSKMVCSFKSNYHNEYTESHAGGRAALSLQFCNLDGLVIVGKAKQLSCLLVGENSTQVTDAHFLRGMDIESTGKIIRRMFPYGSGRRSIMRIGPAGEIGSAMACINVDSYRHFGRMGGGAIMGAKNIKGIVLCGDGSLYLPDNKRYKALYKEVYRKTTSTNMMKKYHDLGTPANLQSLNDISSLPWENLQQTSDTRISNITGQQFADRTLLRNGACAGCPVGCIHVGFIREKMSNESRYHYHQVAYDYEPIFSVGTMLGVTECFDVLRLLDCVEKAGMDAMSAGVALAWATEATEQGLIDERQTLVKLSFGDVEAYQKAFTYFGKGSNDFYQLLNSGTLRAADVYGGKEFACVLGQEMAGYATGELFFAAQTLGFRHSHLDTGAYSYDQKNDNKDVVSAVKFLIDDEPKRVFLTSMVACLFARKVYTDEQLSECLSAVGYQGLAETIEETAEYIRRFRWRVRASTGFDPNNFKIPKRFYKVETWKGKVDKNYLNGLKEEYGKKILQLIE